MNWFRTTSFKPAPGIIAGNAVALLLALGGFWYFATSTRDWTEGAVLHVLMGTCIFIGGIVVGHAQEQLREQDALPLVLLSPATFITLGLMLYPDTRHFMAPITSTIFFYAAYITAVLSGYRLKSPSRRSCRPILKRLGSMMAGFITGVILAVILFSMIPVKNEATLYALILIAVPLSFLVGGLVTGFLLSKYSPLTPKLKFHLQLFACSPALCLIIPAALFTFWNSRQTSSSETFIYLIVAWVISWIGALLGWRLHIIRKKRNAPASPQHPNPELSQKGVSL